MIALKGIIKYLKKNYIVAISCFVAVLCAGIFFVRNEQITRLAADYDDLSIRRSRILKNMKFAAEIDADLERLEAMVADANERLFHPADLASNQRYFYQLESATGVAMSNLQQIVKALPSGKENKKARKKALNSKYQEITYDMNISGTFEQLVSFMREIEGGKAFANVEGFSITQGKADGPDSRVIMRLSVEVLGRKS